MMNSEKQYVDLYADARAVIFRHGPPVVSDIHDAALEDFKHQGFPSRRVKRYHYTNIAALFEPNYGLNLNRLDIPVKPYGTFECSMPNLGTSLYFIVNGTFHAEVLPKATLPKGVVVGSLQKVTSTHPQLMNKYYARLAKTKDDVTTALDTVLAQDNLFIYVPKRIKIDRTVQVMNLLRSDANLMMNRRVLVILDEGAEAKFLFCGHIMDDRHFLATQVIEVYMGENASFDLYCMEETHEHNTHVSNVYVEQQTNSHFNHSVLTLYNGITRSQLNLVFRDEGASCCCNGCIIVDKKQHVDNNAFIRHAVPHCENHELYKYVLDGQAAGTFAGRVLVEKGTQKTNSEMRNQDLCTAKQTHMCTQPELEVYADGMKCSRGSTVDQLDDQAIFYIRQRGISGQEAELLLEFASINEVVNSMQLKPLKDRLHYLVGKYFRDELDKRAGCGNC